MPVEFPLGTKVISLGRMDVFRRFTITFDNRRRIIRFTKIPSPLL